MKNRNASLVFILVTILIDVIGIGIIIPIMPELIMTIGKVKESEASFYNGWMLFAYAIMQFIFAPMMGSLSDRFGRRPILFISLAGLVIDYMIMAVAPDMIWLFIGRCVAGVMGASYTTASAYIADISEPEKRAQNFGMIGVAFGVGFIIGPSLGGLLGTFGLRVPFYFSAALSLLNLLYGIFIIPESLKPENRRAFSWRRANPIGSFYQLSKYPVVLGFIVPIFLTYLAHHAVQSNWNFYTINKFKWDNTMIGYSLTFVGIVVALVQGGLIRIILPRFGQKKSVYAGMVLTMIGFICFAFANQSWMMFVFLIPYALGGIGGPAIQGIMSNEIPANAQGELQGIMTSVMSVTSIIGPLMMNYIFGYFTSEKAPLVFPGAAMLTGAFLTLIGIFFCIKPLAKVRN